jgi:signal transduction histidine kinase
VARSNPAALAILGRSREELEGKRLDELASGFARGLAALDQGEPRVLSLQGPRRVRAVRLGFMDRGMRRAFILLEELTEELRRSEKAAYGKLIRMMSHEVNNTTGAVNSLLDSCLGFADGLDGEQREDFRNALEVATRRNQHMNAFMKGFADVVRLPPPRPEPSDVASLLRDTARLLEQEARRRRIDFRWQLPASPAKVKLDRIQMEQALLNIYRNALEAIDQDGTITTRLEPGPPATISIEDTGGGIPPEVRDQLFTPFFTTKVDGQGIGLTLVQEILLSHGFAFALESRPDGTTVFSIQT